MDLIDSYLQGFKPDTWFDIEIKRKTKKKSDPLRSYYFSAVLPIYMEHLGYEPQEQELFHDQLKKVYFQVQPDKKGIYRNVPHVFSNSESELDVPEKVKFVEWVKRCGAKDGVYIEDPN